MIDLDGRERDRLGRPVPHRLNWLVLMRAVPGLAARFREVPAEYVDADGERAVVRCPCGETPFIEPGDTTSCACGRMYLYAQSLYVANSPVHHQGAA